jgi:AcrR family transcriptional regulator
MEQIRKHTARKPTAARREEVALAALRLIGAQGLSALTTANLAAEVGLTTGALFRHFPSLEAILSAAVACAAGRARTRSRRTRRLRPAAGSGGSARAAAGDEPGIAWMLRRAGALPLPAGAVAELRARSAVAGLLWRRCATAPVTAPSAPTLPEILVVPAGDDPLLAGLRDACRRRRARDQEMEQVFGALRR